MKIKRLQSENEHMATLITEQETKCKSNSKILVKTTETRNTKSVKIQKNDPRILDLNSEVEKLTEKVKSIENEKLRLQNTIKSMGKMYESEIKQLKDDNNKLRNKALGRQEFHTYRVLICWQERGTH